MEALRWAKAQKPRNATQRAVLMAIADYADDTGFGWPSQKTLAEDMLLTDRTIRAALAGLEADELIVRISKRNPDGTRGVDRIQLCLTPELREKALARVHRKKLPVAQPPENNDRTTGKSFQNHRKMLPQPPEANSGQEPSLGEPSVGNPHKRNGSEATASGGRAAHVELSDVDRLWMEGRPNLMSCGMPYRDAGELIGNCLKRGFRHADILAGTYAAVEVGTGDPIRYLNGYLRKLKEGGAARASPRRRTSAATRLIDRAEARHVRQADRNQEGTAAGSGAIIEHESDGRSSRSLH